MAWVPLRSSGERSTLDVTNLGHPQFWRAAGSGGRVSVSVPGEVDVSPWAARGGRAGPAAKLGGGPVGTGERRRRRRCHRGGTCRGADNGEAKLTASASTLLKLRDTDTR